MADPRIAVQIAAVDGFSATLTKFRRELTTTSGAIRAMKLADLPAPDANFERAGQQVLRFSTNAAQATSAMRGLPGLGSLGGIGSIAGIAAMAQNFAAGNVSLRATAQMAGTTASGLNGLRGAAVLTGVSANTADQAMLGLNKTLGEAAFGRNMQAANTMRNLGIDFGSAATGARRAGDVFPEVIKQVERLAQTDPRAAGRLLDILGMPADILPLAMRGAEGIASLTREAERLRPMTDANRQAADGYTLAMGRLELGATGLRDKLVTDLEPALASVMGRMTEVIGRNKEAEVSFGSLATTALNAIRQAGIESGAADFAAKTGLTAFARQHVSWLGREYPDETPSEARWRNYQPAARRSEDDPDWRPDVYGQLNPVGQFMYRHLPGSRANYNANAPAVSPGGAAINKTQAAGEAYGFWTGRGLSPAGAAGMVAMEQAEGGFNPAARGDGGQAHGLFQHHADRRAAILAATGIDMSTASAAQQREGMYQEMARGLDPQSARALPIMQNATDPRVAAAAGVNLIERPADRVGETQKRAAIAADWMARLGRPAPATAVVDAKPEEPDLTRGGRLPSLATPDAPRPAAVSDQSGSTVRIQIDHNNVPDGVAMRAGVEGGSAEIDRLNIRRAMPNAGG